MIGTVENETTVGAYSRIKSQDIQLHYWPSKSHRRPAE